MALFSHIVHMKKDRITDLMKYYVIQPSGNVTVFVTIKYIKANPITVNAKPDKKFTILFFLDLTAIINNNSPDITAKELKIIYKLLRIITSAIYLKITLPSSNFSIIDRLNKLYPSALRFLPPLWNPFSTTTPIPITSAPALFTRSISP